MKFFGRNFWIGFLVIVFLGVFLGIQFHDRAITKGMDTYYSWVEGQRILHKENPYSRIHSGDMRENEKYATYFPAFYELSALSQYFGLRDLIPWASFWRKVIVLFHVLVSLLIYFSYSALGKKFLGFSFALFWLFYRWSLYDLAAANFEPFPIFFMLISLVYFERYPRLSLLSFGVSLALKQIGIFLAPLYVIWFVKKQQGKYLKNVFLAGFYIALLPVLASLPFLFWDFTGFIKSVFFSATRLAAGHFSSITIDSLFGLEGFLARFPMLVFFFLMYYLAWQYDFGKFSHSLLVMAVFVGYNPVLFPQYFSWMTVFVPFLFYDFILLQEKDSLNNQLLGLGVFSPRQP